MDFVEQLKSSIDIVKVIGEYVRLKRVGATGRYVGLCPFHQEKTGSFSVNQSRQFYKCFGCGGGGDVLKFVMEIDGLTFPEAKKICSVVPELSGTCSPADFSNWAETATIDVTVVRSPLGVAETGSVLLSEAELIVNTVGLLAHDIVVLLDPADIVENVHDAYAHSYFRESGCCLLMTGPSGSGDIGAVTIHPAQSSMTLTVIFWPRGK